MVRRVFSAARSNTVAPACDTIRFPTINGQLRIRRRRLTHQMVLLDHEIFGPSQVELSQVGHQSSFTTRNQHGPRLDRNALHTQIGNVDGDTAARIRDEAAELASA